MYIIVLLALFIYVYVRKRKTESNNASVLSTGFYYLCSFAILLIVSMSVLGIYKSVNLYTLLTADRYAYWRQRIVIIFAVLVLFEPFWKKIGEIKILNKILYSDTFIYSIVIVLAALFFCSIYGIRILNPSYTEWLLAADDDLTQHYLGWRAFRSSKWHFPIGMIDTLAYPYLISIIFTDSIPLLAVFCKMLSPVIPAGFQYFGMWGLLCFVLQAYFSAKLFRRFSIGKKLIVTVSVLFLFSPVMIQRMFWHTSLAAQWLILMAFDLIINFENYAVSRRLFFYVALLGFLTASIHIYFVLICGIIIVGLCIKDFAVYRKSCRELLILLMYLVPAFCVVGILGGFSSSMKAADDGLGYFSANLNTLFNPQGWSSMFKDLSIAKVGQYEGFAWIGAGILFGFFFSIILFLNNDSEFRQYKTSMIAFTLIAVFSFLFAISPRITFGDKILSDLTIPEKLRDYWAVFRSSGRVMWPVVYIIMIFSVFVLSKTLNQRLTGFVFIVILLIQVCDMHEKLDFLFTQFHSETTYEKQQKTVEFWEEIASKNVEHVVLGSEYDKTTIFELTNWALDKSMTMNNFYFARSISELVEINLKKALRQADNDTIFLFMKDDVSNCSLYDLNCYVIDGMTVGYAEEIDGYEKIPETKLIIPADE